MKKVIRYASLAIYACAVVVLACTALCWLTGIKPAVVISGSMEPEIKTGSLILIDEKDKDVKPGDIIAFRAGELEAAHRVAGTAEDGYVTKGDSNKTVDPGIVTIDMIRGKVIMDIPRLGYAVRWCSTLPGMLFLLAAAAGIIAAGYLTDEGDRNEEKD